jgi:hypothetical protein
MAARASFWGLFQEQGIVNKEFLLNETVKVIIEAPAK